MSDEDYVWESPYTRALTEAAGPQGVALVKVFGEKTQQGWGLHGPRGEEGFMPRYRRGEFLPRRALYAYEKKNQPFAVVMRSIKLVVIDIDGKNGGLEYAKRLGNLPITLAETSKSGNGYHLFYSTPDDEWDDELGFAQFNDRIGIEQGVDVRAVGCVFHHSTQRWNTAEPAPLPDYLADILRHRTQQQIAATERIIKIREGGDPMETLMLKDELLDDLKKPIPQGKRNTTLFAIGTKLMEAGVDGWSAILVDRGIEVGLSQEEASKIVVNIEKYGAVS